MVLLVLGVFIPVGGRTVDTWNWVRSLAYYRSGRLCNLFCRPQELKLWAAQPTDRMSRKPRMFDHDEPRWREWLRAGCCLGDIAAFGCFFWLIFCLVLLLGWML